MKVQEVLAGDGEEDHLVASRGDPRGERTHDAALAGATGAAWLRRTGGSTEGMGESEANLAGVVREGPGLIPGTLLRSEHSAFPRKLKEEHGIELSYTWVQKALQGAGLVDKRGKRGTHRRRRPRRPMAGMLLHIDGSKHCRFQNSQRYDLIVILDDATSEIYYAQLVEEESTRTVMAGLREVIERKGLFCALYSDRGSHLFVTPKAGEPVDKHRLTQVGRALKELARISHD
jgi:hypothetical protein